MNRHGLLLRLLPLLCLPAISQGVQAADPILPLIRSKAEDAFARARNCGCLWTITMSGWNHQKLERSERSRVEMALIDGKELVGWPGSVAFENREIPDLFRAGAIGTGSLAIDLYNVLISGGATVQSDGEENRRGLKTLRYRFSVPLLSSSMVVRRRGGQVPVSYAGMIWVGATDYIVRETELRIEVPGTAIVRQVEYGEAAAGGIYASIPTHAVTIATDVTGFQERSIMTRGACRRFETDSAISFADQPATAPQPVHVSPRRAVLPAGLSLRLRLETLIDTATAAGGDRIEALLVRAVAEGPSRIARHARVEGRITEVTQSWTPHNVRLGLRFDTVAGQDGPASLRCDLALFAQSDSQWSGARSVFSRVPSPAKQPELVMSGNVVEKNGTRILLPRGFALVCNTL